MNRDAEYVSRIDRWLVLVVVAVIALMLADAWALRVVAPRESLLVAVAMIGAVALLLALSWPCTYTLTDSQLVIRSGLMRLRIAYDDITGVEFSRSLWAGPALSLRRVKVRFAGRFILLSPADRERFIEDLERRAALPKPSLLG